MKSMNVKRIAAVASGLTMLGMAFAGAAVSVDTAGVSSFPFFSAGEPNVKVVIGSKAKPEDVVVGANIAAVIGNLAYKTQTVEVLGKDKLGTGGSGDGSLTDKQVTLSVTTPGVNPATAYEMKAYVEDDLDFSVDTNRSTNTNGARFGSTNTSFSSQAGPKVIGKDQTSLVGPAAGMPSDGKITYPKGSTNTKEEQKIYAFSYVNYDETAKVVQAKYVKTGYMVEFSDPIPLCLDTAKNASAGECTSDSDKLSKSNVEITFLGDKWTIFDYTYTGTGSSTINTLTLGKQITRKESFNIDEQVTTPDGYVIVLKDLSAFSPQRAQFDILDKDGKLIKRLYLGESESSTVSEANNVVVKVNKVFPGAFAKQGIADVSLYSSQLILSNGNEISGGDSHKNWKSQILTAVVGSTPGISKIWLYNDVDQVYKTPVSQNLNAGESIDIIKGMVGYKLNYLGLETVDYDSLTFSILKGYALNTDTSATVTGNILAVNSGKSNAFQFGSRSVSDAYVMLETSDGNAINGQVFYINAAGQYANTSTTNGQLTYFYSSDESAVLFFNSTYVPSWPTANTTATLIYIPELTETNNGTQATYNGNYHLNLLYDPAQDQFVNGLSSTTVDKIGYDYGLRQVPNLQNVATKERGYTTYRGNVFTGISSTSATISYAKKVAQARFTLTAGSTTSSGAGNTASVDLKEGDPYTIGGGYSLKVDKITAKIGGSTGDGSITGLEELKPSVAQAAVVTTLNTDSNPLVVLDSQASDTANLIVVGGQIVNSVAKAAGVDMKSGDQPMVKVYGSTKLVVAGYTAADTSAAGNELIKWLNENRDSVRG